MIADPFILSICLSLVRCLPRGLRLVIFPIIVILFVLRSQVSNVFLHIPPLIWLTSFAFGADRVLQIVWSVV